MSGLWSLLNDADAFILEPRPAKSGFALGRSGELDAAQTGFHGQKN